MRWLKRILLILAIAAAGFALRAAILYYNSQQLGAVSASFPRDYYVGNPSDAPLTYVALGDSTAAGTGVARVEDTLPYRVAERLAARSWRVHVINRAVSGARIADVRRDQITGIEQYRPQLITLNCGANDATHATPLSEYRADMTATLDAMLFTPSAHAIWIATTPDLAPVPALMPLLGRSMAARVALQNDALQQVAATRPPTSAAPLRWPDVAVIDLYHGGKLTGSRMYAADDFHPSAAGYALWASLYRVDTVY